MCEKFRAAFKIYPAQQFLDTICAKLMDCQLAAIETLDRPSMASL